MAWNPLTQKPVWVQPQDTITNGGTLTTAGGLVVQGTEDGYIRFYNATNGTQLHQIAVGTGIVAAPVSYAVDGVQYIAVAAGWNGVKTERETGEPQLPYSNAGRLIVLRLGGGTVSMAPRVERPPFYAGDAPQPAAQVAAGAKLYQQHCYYCHGVIGEASVFPDLRRMSPGTYEAFEPIVLGGLLRNGGMASFADVLGADDVQSIRAYIVDWAQRSRRGDSSSVPAAATTKDKGSGQLGL